MSFFSQRRAQFLGALAVGSVLTLAVLPIQASGTDKAEERAGRLARGEIVVGSHNQGETKFITGSVLINAAPEKVWPIMANPFEFQGKISPRMREVEIMLDKVNLSVMKVTMDVPVFLPRITYIVESKYLNNERIDFRRVGGTLKDFKGFWSMYPMDGGKKTELTYSMYLDPGFFVPQWIVREGVKSELPHTLELLRTRIMEVCEESQPLVQRNILAANVGHHSIAATARGAVY